MKKRIYVPMSTVVLASTLCAVSVSSLGYTVAKAAEQNKQLVAEKKAVETAFSDYEKQVQEEQQIIDMNAEINRKICEMYAELNALDKSDKMTWFIQYKDIQNRYAQWIDPDETIYDCFSQEELDFLFRIVEAEVTGVGKFQAKCNVASVIFNRLKSDKFANDIRSILSSPHQFSTYSNGRYNHMEVSDETRLACEYAFQIEDATNGALYFDSTNGNSWADGNRTFVLRDNVGHSFYK